MDFSKDELGFYRKFLSEEIMRLKHSLNLRECELKAINFMIKNIEENEKSES